jgi:Ribbon-helix-helix protein, copG family
MHMLERRLQILLDDERYRRVERVARARGTSVAAVIRDAIDRGLPETPKVRSTAARRILAAPDMPVPVDPADLRRELDDLRGRRS